MAVKIAHPRVEESIKMDLELMRVAAIILPVLIPALKWLSLPAEVTLFSAMMLEQVDLRRESVNLARFRENFGATGKAWGGGEVVRFPGPVMGKRGVLVEELVSDACIPIQTLVTHGRGKTSSSGCGGGVM